MHNIEEIDDFNKEINVYYKSHLPKNGWLQACFSCREFTSKTIYFYKMEENNVTTTIYIHCCNRCKKTHENVETFNIFSEKCYNYLYSKYLLPY